MLRNILFYIVFLPTTIIGSLLTIVLKWFDKSERMSQAVANTWAKITIAMSPIRLVVERDSVPVEGNYVFLSNHQSQLDIPVLFAALAPFNIKFVAKESLFRIPVFGQAIRAMGCIPIDRHNRRKAMRSMQEAVDRTNKGQNILVFPEGTRYKNELGEFKIGGIVLALKTQKNIVPVVVTGTADIVTKGKYFMNKGTVIVRTLDPINADQYTIKDRDRVKDTLWEKMDTAFKENRNWLLNKDR